MVLEVSKKSLINEDNWMIVFLLGESQSFPSSTVAVRLPITQNGGRFLEADIEEEEDDILLTSNQKLNQGYTADLIKKMNVLFQERF